MHYNQTPHAVNIKERDAIVYVDAFGETIQITAESIGQDSFKKWKEWSDEYFYREAKEEHLYRDHTVSLESLAPSEYAVPDCETLLFEAEERRERAELRSQVGIAFFTCLTDTQQERMWLYAIEGHTTREIAEKEGAKHQSVCESVGRGRKNILKFLEKGPCQNAVFAAYSEGAIKNPS